MWLWAKGSLQRPQPHEVNQTRLFNPLFHQEVLHMAKCGGNHFLPSDSHLGQWRSYSRCMWPKVHIMDVDVCSTHVSQVEGVYMDSIKVKVHREINLWQMQRNLMGTSECGWTYDPGWFLMIPRYHLFRLEAQEGLWRLHKNLTFSIQSFMPILMMIFSSRMQVQWMGIMSFSP
jgi:hypothetical protein